MISFVLIGILSCCFAFAQEERTLKGNVVDQNGEPVVGAVVFIKGTTNGTSTDSNGAFKMFIPAGEIQIETHCIGYKTDERLITAKESNVNITLREEAMNLDEVVVVGYGEFSRKSITSAIAKLDGDELADLPASSLNETLKGKIAGLHIVQTDNTPGGGFSMKIRGGSSITNGNEPLVYVDGVERSMSTIDPNDVASIEVLKDAASSAVYGARGSNGVILVTTKKGGYERPVRVTFEAKVAYQEPETKRDFLNAEEYISILRPAVAISQSPTWNFNSGWSASSGNSGSSIYSTRYYNEGDVLPAGWKTMVDPIDNTKMLMFCDTDWQSIMFRPAFWQNYYIGIDGGGKNVRYSGSASYVDDQGIGLATGYKKFSVKSNAEAKIGKKLTATLNMSYQYTDQDAYANQRDAISRGLSATPTQITYFEDGTPAQGYNNTSQTPIYYTYYSDNTDVRQYLTLNGGLKLDILPGWTANVSGSMFNLLTDQTTFLRANMYDSSRPATSYHSSTMRLKMDAYTQYQHTWADSHNFNAMVGYSYQNRMFKSMEATGSGGSSDKISTINASSLTTGTSTGNQDVQIGFFGRVNYDYKSRYLLTLVARYDASSKFMKANRWGFFPGISGGWIVTEEPFMKDVNWLDYLKARVSYGLTGNNNIGINDAQGNYNATYVYNGNAAIRGTAMPNENLFWETTKQLDLGIEFGVLDNRIYLSADYYDKYTTNLLYDMHLPNTSGYSSVTTNMGTVRFWGWEFDLTTKNIDRKDFSWESKLIMNFNKNIVVKLPDNGMDRNRTSAGGYTMYSNGDGTYFGGLAEGEPLYRFYGYKAIDIYQTDEEAAQAPYDELARGYNYKDGTIVAGRKFAGDYNWADRNGDNRITKGQDLFCLGVTEPVMTGGFNNSFRFKDFSLNIYLDYAVGHSIYDDSLGRYFYATFSCNYALSSYVKDCWKKPGDVTRWAKFWANDSGAGQDNFNRMSNIFTYRGDYLCVREISLSYNVPKNFCKKLHMDGLQITLSGNNLHYFTAVKGISPEIGTASTYDSGYANYPPARRISLGLKLTF